MSKLTNDIRKFHEKFGLSYDGLPRTLPHDLEAFRIKFMREELEEYISAASDRELQRMEHGRNTPLALAEVREKQLDALVDLVYVALGTAYLQGFDFDRAWNRVHRANMSKVRATKKTAGKRGAPKFDVVKPAGWKAPQLKDLV
ncbi:MAG: hypothetical protein E6R03_01060 [Hyphomicrobiaceae bacterium]|nr:MAG: hypothetical protein E6R03_01060 [Hyphomicrobiaceae bacterium]